MPAQGIKAFLKAPSEAVTGSKRVLPTFRSGRWQLTRTLRIRFMPALGMEEYPAAYTELQRAVRADPKLLPVVISRVWRSSEDVGELLNNALPANTESYLAALDFFASTHQPEPALAVWQRLVALGKPFPLKSDFVFFEELIRSDRSDEARVAWEQALAAAGLPHDEPSGQNLIWDGSFAQDFSQGGLGWRWTPLLDADMSVDPQPAPDWATRPL